MSIPEEPVPSRLLRVVRSERSGPDRSNVVRLRRRRSGRWTWPQWAALAASLMVGVIAARLAPLRTGDPIDMRGGRLVAEGALAGALSDQLAAGQTAAGPVRIGVSFRSKSGEYCRTFMLRRPARLAGLACRTGEHWQISVLAHTVATTPPAVAAAVADRIAGAPLDPTAESAARGRHWRP